eukprot:CAMPEP_0197078354 /NCGR_PEP_ID=MMETSP1384-20130603/213079_1 /TAXON_ID=29189 /ORGANISM="Ammonia sp." /LENGTH=188 /DNA_ID=CAMNT_0042517219 /DNA_START=136 /DNA_END=699 /DNA_ORIENTATION=-
MNFGSQDMEITTVTAIQRKTLTSDGLDWDYEKEQNANGQPPQRPVTKVQYKRAHSVSTKERDEQNQNQFQQHQDYHGHQNQNQNHNPMHHNNHYQQPQPQRQQQQQQHVQPTQQNHEDHRWDNRAQSAFVPNASSSAPKARAERTFGGLKPSTYSSENTNYLHSQNQNVYPQANRHEPHHGHQQNMYN